MKRAHAVALSLVNWKGVFFERYLLDRHVTALEGANGAGKTTVMIAAYVVLLPDLQRLKFTNLGETGATGGDRGIWGRLGEPGPSYAAIEIELGASERVLCGVYLERKAAPSLSLTPFLISRIPPALSSEHFMLRQRDGLEEVCRFEELPERVEEQGCTIEVFGSGKEYFARLFELGITALRLGTDEERNKLNDMLRTSMTGGISRTLTSDLRSFLFKRESGLLDTLTRMRENLDACRRTRLDVSEARVLEREISGIYAAGHAMFSAALGASRAARTESELRLAEVELAHQRAVQASEELETRLEEVQLRNSSLSPRLERARAAEQAARERLTQIERATAAAERLRAARAAFEQTDAPAAEALERKGRAAAERESSKALRNEAQATLARAAAGLANLQTGLEELHRQSHAFGRVREQLALARRLLADCLEPSGAQESLTAALRALDGLEGLEVEGSSSSPTAVVSDARRRVAAARSALDLERAAQHRQASTLEQRQRDYGAARAALASLCGTPDTDAPGALARRELARSNQLEVLASRVPELERDVQRTSQLAERQRALGAELRALGFEPLPNARDFAAALATLEQRARAAEHQQREHELAAARESERAEALALQGPALQARAERYRRLGALADHLASRGQPAPRTRAELSEQMRALEGARRAAHERGRHAEQRREQALALALALEPSSQGPGTDLLRLAERVDGQLLATRYENLELEDARRMQAELGPLTAAIVVEDPEAAVAAICAEKHTQESVWLVRAAAWPPPDRFNLPQVAGHQVVDFGPGLRVTRLPANVQLGRAARERRARELRAEAESCASEHEAVQRELSELDAARAELEQLWEHWEIWALGDPAEESARTAAALVSAREQSAEQQRLGRAARLEAARLLGQYAAARPFLGDHHLLDPPDHAALAEAAARALELGRGAAAELERTRPARATLLAQLHLLDSPAPDAAEPQTWRETAARLDAQSDRLFAVAEALSASAREPAAWAWSEAPRALAERTELVPELEAQHERAQLEVARVQELFERAEADWEAATGAAQAASAERTSREAHLERALAELAAEGAAEPASGVLEQQQLEVAERAQAVERLRAEERGIEADLALCRERLNEGRLHAQRALGDREREQGRSAPIARRSQELLAAAHEVALLEESSLEESGEPAASRSTGSAQLWLEAESKRALLTDRLLAARGGAELAQAAVEARQDALVFGPRVLELWLAVRAWLSKRLPAPLAELTPKLGLSRLEADLAQLERRLEHQEGDLRGTSSDVARSIEVQVRRATAQVRRLNGSLEGVSFGSIHGIRVQSERVTKMDQVLRALRDGETQELLFQSNLPIEAALDEIFRRHSGGRNGGERLIDYREYLDLWVCIQRQPGADWERVNPSQVSTGEAIGIGAALMMVILAEWEREDQLLRRQRSLGSLRFLFLDEANRLSQDNLGVLFDLCRTLDLQLLIAAPEVARAEGNTTYRLVRRVNDAGQEEVLVTGRRASLPCPAVLPPPIELAPIAPAAPVQAALFTN